MLLRSSGAEGHRRLSRVRTQDAPPGCRSVRCFSGIVFRDGTRAEHVVTKDTTGNRESSVDPFSPLTSCSSIQDSVVITVPKPPRDLRQAVTLQIAPISTTATTEFQNNSSISIN
ncbi:hypothetical protein J6590_053113 [Homalodisca vitripennis]|nr:hypothetical protein J6590_053113 [Homalodisca vitripennis]